MFGGGVGVGEGRQNGRPFGRLNGCWSFSAGSDRGAEWSAAALESGAGAGRGGEHDAGVTVADVARQDGATCWQIYDWRKQLRKGNLVVRESMASLPDFAELSVGDCSVAAPAAADRSDIEIVAGDVVTRRRSTLRQRSHSTRETIARPS